MHNIPNCRTRLAICMATADCMHSKWSPKEKPQLLSPSLPSPFYSLERAQSPGKSIHCTVNPCIAILSVVYYWYSCCSHHYYPHRHLGKRIPFPIINVFRIFHCFICVCFPTNPTSFSSSEKKPSGFGAVFAGAEEDPSPDFSPLGSSLHSSVSSAYDYNWEKRGKGCLKFTHFTLALETSENLLCSMD